MSSAGCNRYLLNDRYLIMTPEEFLTLLSDNHRQLILGGGIICLISLFLPFYKIDLMFSYGSTIFGSDASLSSTWLLWPFLIGIGALFYGYYQGYGERYPHLFLIIGGLFVLMTLYGTQIYAGGGNLVTILYGFFCEFLGSLAVAVGGYYYYLGSGPAAKVIKTG